MLVYNSEGKEVTLGSKIGAGGEGSVYSINGQPEYAAKIYNKEVEQEKCEKLAAMVRLKNDKLLRISAWPVDTLYSTPGGPMVGFVMKRVIGKPIHILYSPKSRIAEFPNAGWDFLVHAASNLARAFFVMHENGHVIGDVNHGNVCILNNGTVMLIDCDSFQISTGNGRYLCEVGVMTHQPPELQDVRSFRNIIRTYNHDNFGLAVLIFQLLFMGRHPFAGRFFDREDMTIEKAIKESRFVYSSAANPTIMEPPPNTIPLAAVSQPVAALFERAFLSRMRPNAREWVIVLEGLRNNLKSCGNLYHKHFKGLQSCPWCEIEGKAGVVLFNFARALPDNQGTFNMTTVVSQINGISVPGPVPAVPSQDTFSARPSRRFYMYRNRRKRWAITSGVILVISILTVVILQIGFEEGFWIPLLSMGISAVLPKSVPSRVRIRARDEYNDANRRMRDLLDRWQNETDERTFYKKKSELLHMIDSYRQLSNVRIKWIQELEANRRKNQFNKFLNGYRISDSRIDGISSARKAVLQSYGVETAADIDYNLLVLIPGLSGKHINKLMQWRQKIEYKFTYNPGLSLDPVQIASIDRKINDKRMMLEKELGDGVIELKHMAEQIEESRKTLLPEIEDAMQEFAQADANYRCCKG